MELDDAQRITNSLTLDLSKRAPVLDGRLSYLRGKSGVLRFASDKFRDYFRGRYESFSDNWCLPVAQATAERMNYHGLRPYGKVKGFDQELDRVWQHNDADGGSSEAFLVFAAASRSFALVSPTPDPNTPRITWEHPSQAIVDYDPATGAPRAGLVAWADGDRDFATLYTPGWVCRMERESSTESTKPVLHGGWEPRGEEPIERNPFGEVPLVELRNQSLLDDDPMSDISGVASMQDAINLVWAYLLNHLDYTSLPQRILTGADVPMVPILDNEGQEIGTRPVDLEELIKERIMFVPGDNVNVAEWTAANLEGFSHVIERGVEHIAAQTRTPPHYLIAKMVNTAAESLTVAEAGLVSKTGERITSVNPAMKRLNRLVAISQGGNQRRLAAISAGSVLWADIQYRSEAQRSDALLKKRQMGYPFEYILEQDGLSPEEVNRVLQMRDKELALDPLAAAQFTQQTGM